MENLTVEELSELPLESLSREQRTELLSLLEEKSKRKLLNYSPYPKQILFHSAGLTHRERLFRAGNQLGKSMSGAAEMAMHLTGRYPEWWEGRKFNKAISAWSGGVTGEVTRDTIQRLLIGAFGQSGTGFIPERDIQDTSSSRGIANLCDTILVKHYNAQGVQDGVSRLRLKYYEQGREKWQADTVDLVWFDEEPPQDIYTEGLTRTNATGGFVYMTFTPLLGMSEVVRRFLSEPSPDRADINMTIDDVLHISASDKAKIVASYPAHERESRLNGTPMLGSGRIFPVSEELITVPRFELPKWYFLIGGIDFGWDHPTAGIKLAYNPDIDTVYVVACYKRKEATPTIHTSSLRTWGKELAWAWPHDGLQHDKGSGEKLADQYRDAGLNMLPERSTFDDGSNGVEAGIIDMLTRMENGTWKVFDDCKDWLDEFRMYHRKDGKVIKEFDDCISASRYALMMLRYARPETRKPSQEQLANNGHVSKYEPLTKDAARGR